MGAGRDLPLHGRPRHQAARPRLRGRDLRVRRPRSGAAATRAAAWASTPRATSTSPPATRTRRSARTATRATTSPRAARPAPNVASNDHCGTNGISFNDARRTAGSTNDYNGKMLRFNPVDTIPDGSQPTVGVNSTYTLPNAQSPNGPNLFSGTEGNGSQAKPEIYAMGLRNPSRLFIDPETDIPYSAWVGPDAGSPSATQGPSTYENATQLPTAGNYGWPYCMGNQQAYRDRVADGSLRTTNAAGYVSGGPAASPTQGWYDCNNLVNDSTNNTGLTVLPHADRHGEGRRPRAAAEPLVQPRQPGRRQRLPELPARARAPNNAPNYGAQPDRSCARTSPPPARRSSTAPSTAMTTDADGQLGPLARVLGRPLVPAGLRQQQRQARPAARPGHRPGRRQAGLRRQPARRPELAGQLHGLEVRARRRALRAGLLRLLHAPARRPACTGSPTPAARTRRTPTRSGRPPARRAQIRFSLGSSGGVSYEWDFGDGSPTSTEREPDAHLRGRPARTPPRSPSRTPTARSCRRPSR